MATLTIGLTDPEYLNRRSPAIPYPFAATMQLASLATGGGRFLVKKPITDAIGSSVSRPW